MAPLAEPIVEQVSDIGRRLKEIEAERLQEIQSTKLPDVPAVKATNTGWFG